MVADTGEQSMGEMNRSIVSILLCLLIAAAPCGFGAPVGKIAQESIPCIPDRMNARIVVRVTGLSGIGSVRVYFRYTGKAAEDDLKSEAAVASEDKNPYSYMEMRQAENGLFWAVLPKPEDRITAVQYRIVATDGENLRTTSDLFTIPIRTDCPVNLSDDEKKFAVNLVVGLTVAEQTFVPKGFLCDGIVGQITVTGELKPAECTQKVGAIWVAAAAAGLAGAGVVVVTGGGGGQPVSPSRPAPQPTVVAPRKN
jgi:hypothetical protein